MSIIEKAFEKLDKLEHAEPNKIDRPPPAAAEPPLKVAESDEQQTTVFSPQRELPSSAPEQSGDFETARRVELDFQVLQASHIITPEKADSHQVEEHRHIKRPLLMNASPSGADRIEHGNLIMVTSSVPGEGKTFTAVNLAMSIAMERDRTVLLVDADVAKSDVKHVLGIDAAEGLTDLLVRDDLTLADVLLKTNVPKLTVLPAGRQYPNVTELFSSEQMRDLADQLSNRYRDRVVVFDCPPLLAASGASVLAGLAGQIVFVVEAEKTSESTFQEGLKLLGRTEHVGLVLNKSRQRARSKYYGYGYGYGYGYYGN